MTSLHQGFREASAAYLHTTYLPRLERALATLPKDALWWSPHDGAISFGVILRHLEGNVRQWILSGLGGRSDERQRASEFGEPSPADGEKLLGALRLTVDDAAQVIREISDAALQSPVTIQGMETTGMGAIYHVVEHFSWHVGQAVWIAKARAGAQHGLHFYDDAVINRARNDR